MTEIQQQSTVPSVADQGAAHDRAIDDGAQGGASRLGGRPAFLSAMRQQLFPTVPEPLAVAVSAIEGAVDLERAVMTAAPEGLAAFCQGVANDVLAGKGYPADFAEAAYLAQQAADRLNAQSIAVQEIRRRLHETFPAVVAAALPGLLSGLRKQVKECLDGLREVDRALGGLDLTDPAAVAAASDEERAAFLRLGELHTSYKLARYAQRASLQASATPAPNWNDLLPSGDTGWPAVFEVGVHEVSNPNKYGSPSGSLGSVARFRSLARRPDVWVPTVPELTTAWDVFDAPITQPATSTIGGTA